MEILDGFSAGQPPAKSHRLDGGLTEIQTHTFSDHGVSGTP
jgi:hypothetical protein